MIDPTKDQINFINISSDSLNLFEWKPPRSFKSYVLDLNIVKENKASNIFFHIDKGNQKIVHIRINDLIYSIGTSEDVQFQILEAILEKVHELFHQTYDISVILSFSNTNPTVFKHFKQEVDDIIENFHKHDLIKRVNVYCNVCKGTLPLYVKKSIMKGATSFPIPLVFTHNGHAVVTYIDQDFVVRGVELVHMTG
jgi:hypothetical protein